MLIFEQAAHSKQIRSFRANSTLSKLSGVFLERAREPVALYFVVRLSGFAGSELGWLSYDLNSNELEDSRKIVRGKVENPIHKFRLQSD